MAKLVKSLSLAQHSSFPITDALVVDYVRTLTRIAPEITAPVLQKVVDGCLTGKYQYNPNDGIRNLFSAFEEHKRTRQRYLLQNEKTGEMIEVTEDDNENLYDPAEWVILRAKAASMLDMSRYRHPRFRTATYHMGEAAQKFGNYCKTNDVKFKDFIEFI